jgi:Superfamily II RNA helicase
MSQVSDIPREGHVTAVLGPTNTGKTHHAVTRMLANPTGMIGLPLRLLAREVYDRVVAQAGKHCTALITGEEKIIPKNVRFWVCTVESMPMDLLVDFLAIDEIQLAQDPERGHVFTDRILHARGRHETMLMGSLTMAPILQRLLPDLEIQTRERLSDLSYGGIKKISRLPRRSAIVAFSANDVYEIAELIRRQKGGAAVVLGALSPRTRNAQVALYEEVRLIIWSPPTPSAWGSTWMSIMWPLPGLINLTANGAQASG